MIARNRMQRSSSFMQGTTETSDTIIPQLSVFIVPQKRQVQKSLGIPASPQVKHTQVAFSLCGLFIRQASHCNAEELLRSVQIVHVHWGNELPTLNVLAGGAARLLVEDEAEMFVYRVAFPSRVTEANEADAVINFDCGMASPDGPGIDGFSSTIITSESESLAVRSMTLFSTLSLAALSASL